MLKSRRCLSDIYQVAKMNLRWSRVLFSKIYQRLMVGVICLFPYLAFAQDDPISKAGNRFYNILFGTLGTSLCAIIIGATFILAKVGKVSWDKFLYIGFCTAGFLGAPSIITLIQSSVGGH